MKIDATHAMYQPDKRAKRSHRRAVLKPGEPGADQYGTREQREAWMRWKQHEKERIAEAASAAKRPRKVKVSILDVLVKKRMDELEKFQPDESGVWAI